MIHSQVILPIPFNKLALADSIFMKYSGIDVNHIPSRYGDKVVHAKQLILEQLNMSLIYQCISIACIDDDLVTLESHHTLHGKIPALVLKDSKEVICYVITLSGYTNLANSITNKLLYYFVDTWGTAFIEAGVNYLKTAIDSQLAPTPFRRTYLWSPGSAQFELENQKSLFNLLNPEQINCTLDEYYRMYPTKSISGIIGLLPKEKELYIKPCTYCDFSKACSHSQLYQCL